MRTFVFTILFTLFHSLAFGQASAAVNIQNNQAVTQETPSSPEETELLAQEERTPVIVAAYEFPPYYSARLERHFLGDLLGALNRRQDKFDFILREVRPQDRYVALAENGCCDVMFFESVTWGWPNNKEYFASEPVLRGADRMYSKQNENWQPSKEDRVGGVVGYHYNYTRFDVDVDVSEDEFMMYRADSQLTLLNMLQNNRLQFAIFTEEFINWLAVEEPHLIEGLYSSPEPDGVYTTQVLVSAGSPISLDELMQIFGSLLNEPSTRAAIEHYRLERLQTAN